MQNHTKHSLNVLRMGEEVPDRGTWEMELIEDDRDIWQPTSLAVVETIIPAFPHKAVI